RPGYGAGLWLRGRGERTKAYSLYFEFARRGHGVKEQVRTRNGLRNRSTTIGARCARSWVVFTAGALVLGWLPSSAFAHGVSLERELPASSQYFALGVTHILGGIDHLLFLAGLVLIGGRL